MTHARVIQHPSPQREPAVPVRGRALGRVEPVHNGRVDGIGTVDADAGSHGVEVADRASMANSPVTVSAHFGMCNNTRSTAVTVQTRVGSMIPREDAHHTMKQKNARAASPGAALIQGSIDDTTTAMIQVIHAMTGAPAEEVVREALERGCNALIQELLGAAPETVH